MSEEGFEPTRRELCPDGSCVGLIGPDGRCRVCGTVAPSVVADPRRQGMAAHGDDDAPAAADLDDDRELCPDGACVGLVGPDGRCKVCGTRGTGPVVAAAASPPALVTASAATTGDDVDDEDRELCPDGTCIGLIGSDGTCKVCGLPRATASP
jgi:hypothetical protein